MRTVTDPQTLLEDRESLEEKLALAEYDLRLAQEDIVKLKDDLQRRAHSVLDQKNGNHCIYSAFLCFDTASSSEITWIMLLLVIYFIKHFR